tara:strand:+ start:943 stop:1098 length:156 start_codon:yes stop_codon:yes gene_type:complete
MIDFLADYAGIIGLLIFCIFFAVMLFWVFRPGSKAAYSNHANIPLKEGENE